MKRKYSFKRQFRCHECGWRGWMDETRLRYPAASMPREADHSISQDIPSLDLNDRSITESPPDGPALFSDVPGKVDATGQEPSTDLPVDINHPVSASAKALESASGPREDVSLPDFYHEDVPAGLSYDVPVESFRKSRKRSGHICPKCGMSSLFRSRHRGFVEVIRKSMTGKRPYRCHKCGWRGWLQKV